MNKIIINHLLKNFLSTFMVFTIVFYCFGLILNLFEEIEFFKNTEVSVIVPLMLTSIYIPSLIIKILPFIIFLSSMWYMIKIRNNKELLILKTFGYSNIKIFLILATTSFILGWLVLLVINPISSSMSKYYEETKSNYSKDINHLVSFNRNGLWIKENIKSKQRIINASKLDGFKLFDVSIYHLSQNSNLIEKIFSDEANIKNNNWELKNVSILNLNNGIFTEKKYDEYNMISLYNYEKINSLFKNFDTISFLNLIFEKNIMLNNGYNKSFLDQSFHSMLSLPFFLFLMTGMASILTLYTLKKSSYLSHILLGIIVCIIVFYFKDFSIALGQTNRIPLILSIWAPVIGLSFFTSIGILQINEK